MKKILILMLCLALALGLSACGAKESEGPSEPADSAQSQTGQAEPAEIPSDALLLKLKPSGGDRYTMQKYAIVPGKDEFLVGYAADKNDIYYVLTDYVPGENEHTKYDFYHIDISSGESERVLALSENGESFHVGQPQLMGGKVYFTASNSRQNGIACFDPENDTIETIEELPVNASAVSFSGDGRYLAWIYDENGSLKLFSCDTQTRETRQLSSGISEEFGIATLFVNDGICTVQEESALGSFAISYDLASGDKLSEKLIPEEFEVNKLQGSRKLLSLTDGIGKDALVYMGTHGSEGFIPLFKESGEHISSFSSHILEDRIVINSQNPPELMVIYPEEGLYETIALDAPLFAARVSSDGLFTGVDTLGNQIICIELK